MKKILIIMLIAFTSCTSRYDEGGENGSCTVYDSDGGVTIECPDGSEATVKHGTSNTTTPTGPNSLSRYLYCDSTLSNTNLSVYYRLATFTTGYTFVIAGIYGLQTEVNNSVIYPFSHVDYQSSPVYFTHDLAGDANGGYWKIYYSTQSYNVIVDYIDLDDSFTWELTECILEDY